MALSTASTRRPRRHLGALRLLRRRRGRRGGARHHRARLWRHIPWPSRAAAVRRFRQALAKAGETLIVLSTRETGRPPGRPGKSWPDAPGRRAASSTRAMAPGAQRRPSRPGAAPIRRPAGGGHALLLRPAGLLPCAATAAAMLGGNTLVFKPSKFTPPGLGQLLAEMWDQCKLPRGVFNMVQGPGSAVGRRLLGHPRLAALMFAGSHETASEVRRLLLDRPEIR
ncbi:MAG: aldehyde dehydrogenase family protein [Sandaracinaceae bacterium]|nr:aldehyde dehydrogenase family protein [Sandaracinaceae bacterium]